MDTSELVTFQVDAGKRFIAQLVRDGFPISAALWVKTAEEVYWFLYVATPLVEQQGLAETYRHLQASLQQLQGIPLSFSDIKLIGVNNPITQEVLEILRRHPGRLATSFQGKQLGSMTIDGAYIYPSYLYLGQNVGQMSREDVLREVVRFMDHGTGVLQPAKITLKNGNSFEGVPFSLQVGPQGTLAVQFVDSAEPFPRAVSVDDIASVQ